MNHFEAHPMVESREVDSKVLRMTIKFEYFFLIKRQHGECNNRNFRGFLFGMSPDVPAFKARVFTSDSKVTCTTGIHLLQFKILEYY